MFRKGVVTAAAMIVAGSFLSASPATAGDGGAFAAGAILGTAGGFALGSALTPTEPSYYDPPPRFVEPVEERVVYRCPGGLHYNERWNGCVANPRPVTLVCPNDTHWSSFAQACVIDDR